MTRLTHCIVHAGSHKTGTTSLQDALSARRAELAAEEFSTRIGNPDPWAGFDDDAYGGGTGCSTWRGLRSVRPEGAPVEAFLGLRGHESYAHALYATKALSGQLDCSFAEFVQRCAPIFGYRRQAEVLAEVLGPVRRQSFDALRGDLVNGGFAWLRLPLRVERTPRLRPTPTPGPTRLPRRCAACEAPKRSGRSSCTAARRRRCRAGGRRL